MRVDERRSLTWRLSVIPVLILAAAWIVRCSSAYKDPSTGPGQQNIVDQVNNDLTAGDCGSALNLLQPIIGTSAQNDQYVLLYSAAYACEAGVSVPNIIGSLNNSNGADVWSVLIKSDYSNGNDGHLANLNLATNALYLTAQPSGNTEASQRPTDANTYMVFLAAMTIATVISPAGDANPSSGEKTQSIAGDKSPADECQIQVAVAQMSDSLNYVTISGGLANLSNTVTTVCSGVPGGCPTNQSYQGCLQNPAEQAAGQAMIVAIDGIWQ